MKKILLAAFIILCLFLGNSTGGEVSLCFTGDILLDRGVEMKLLKEGYDYPYENVNSVLKSVDITFGNLECPLTDRGAPILKKSGLSFKGDSKNAAFLKGAGYDILNLANNHTLDCGVDGLKDTMSSLAESGIQYTGAGITHFPGIINVHGIKVGFLGYSDVPLEGYSNNEEYGISAADENSLKKDIAEAGKLCDFLIVSLHFGEEYNYYPDKAQKNYARSAIDSGAGMVIGHHPHVLQGFEKYNGKYIFYSLGNFIFDSQAFPGTSDTVILNVKIDKTGVKNIEMLPIKIEDCRPVLADDKESEYILGRLKMYSEDID